MKSPDWLSTRDAHLQLSPDGRAVLVLFSGSPQYRLTPTPARGGYTCAVIQSVSGKRLDRDGPIHATSDEALSGGLDVLRSSLGW